MNNIGGNVAKRFTLEKIKELYQNETREILDCEVRKYGTKKGRTTYVKFRCLIDNYEGWQRIGSMQSGQGCPICSGNTLYDGNRLSIVRPDLIRYFKNKEDAGYYTVSSSKKAQLVCPDCGEDKSMQISTLSSIGFSCTFCSDGISVPEKFGIGVLKQLKIEFETQKTFKWANKKKYDFYIPSLNMIIETHGGQHYEETRRKGARSLEEEQENDLLKYNLAIENGIKPDNYIMIDCRNSEFEWLKENFIKSLKGVFNLCNLNFEKIWEDCQLSLVPKIWEEWNNRKENDTTTTIGKMFGLNRCTIVKYLKDGDKIKKCIYNGKEELIKNGLKNGKKGSKKVYQYSLRGVYLNVYESCSDAERKLGISSKSISACCNGKLKTSGGFKWSHKLVDLRIKRNYKTKNERLVR